MYISSKIYRKQLKKGMKSAKSMPLQLPPPPPTRPPMKAHVRVESITRDEIVRYWEQKKINEEEHLLAAQKAAARLRARALTEEDYRRFEDSLKDALKDADYDVKKYGVGGENNKELQVGIKDWWTKSKYAYLNQPAAKSMEEDATEKRATATYIPQKARTFTSSASCLYASSFGVFNMINVRPIFTQ